MPKYEFKNHIDIGSVKGIMLKGINVLLVLSFGVIMLLFSTWIVSCDVHNTFFGNSLVTLATNINAGISFMLFGHFIQWISDLSNTSSKIEELLQQIEQMKQDMDDLRIENISIKERCSTLEKGAIHSKSLTSVFHSIGPAIVVQLVQFGISYITGFYPGVDLPKDDIASQRLHSMVTHLYNMSLSSDSINPHQASEALNALDRAD